MVDIIAKGGYVILVIMACSLTAVAVIVERALYYQVADRSIRKFIKWLEEASADELAEGPNREMTNTFCQTLWGAAAALPRSEREMRQSAVEDALRSEIPSLEKNLYLLTTAATVAPLLGLLGTVLGMIKTFQAASMSGLGNPQMLAEGISEALYNTAGGLLVAIPCIIANNHFRSRVERLLHWAESCAGKIVRQASQTQGGLSYEIPEGLAPCERTR